MKAFDVFPLLSVAIFLLSGESSDAVELKSKVQKDDDRKLQYGYEYFGYESYYDETGMPTNPPTFKPTAYPTPRPTPLPTGKPSPKPTSYPTPRPTPHPTFKPSPRPTRPPTAAPIPHPTRVPSPNPTPLPTRDPTIRPTPRPSKPPTDKPTSKPSRLPTPKPTRFPTRKPTPKPTRRPTNKPTGDVPSAEPSEEPTLSEEPSESPTISDEPSESPTSVSSFSSTSTGTGCVGETVFEVICAERNANVLGDLCDALVEAELEDPLNDCNRRFTVFAPNNRGMQRFFNFFNDAFFRNPDNFPLAAVLPSPDTDIVTDGDDRRLQRTATCEYRQDAYTGNGDCGGDDRDAYVCENGTGRVCCQGDGVDQVTPKAGDLPFESGQCVRVGSDRTATCLYNYAENRCPTNHEAYTCGTNFNGNTPACCRGDRNRVFPDNPEGFGLGVCIRDGSTPTGPGAPGQRCFNAFNFANDPSGTAEDICERQFGGTANFPYRCSEGAGFACCQQNVNTINNAGNGLGRCDRIEVNPDFRENFLRAVFSYHVTSPNLYRAQDLSCIGRQRFIQMMQRGTSETQCQNAIPFGQRGTCNAEASTPRFEQINIFTANGIIHVMNNVLIPSPDGTVEGCDLIQTATLPDPDVFPPAEACRNSPPQRGISPAQSCTQLYGSDFNPFLCNPEYGPPDTAACCNTGATVVSPAGYANGQYLGTCRQRSDDGPGPAGDGVCLVAGRTATQSLREACQLNFGERYNPYSCINSETFLPEQSVCCSSTDPEISPTPNANGKWLGTCTAQ